MGHLKKKLLEQKYLHIDETLVQILNEPGRKNTTESYMWGYSSIKGCEQPVRYFEYQPGRSGKYPQDFLEGFRGYIHTDAYKGYNGLPDVTRCLLGGGRNGQCRCTAEISSRQSLQLCDESQGRIDELPS